MTQIMRQHPTEDWINQIFAAKAAQTGGVVRRKVSWVDREIGRDRLIAEVRKRGFHMIECAGQFVIVCAPAPIRMIC